MSTVEGNGQPVYLSQSGVARRLGVGRAAVANYMTRFPDEVPTPAAYLEQGEEDSVREPLPLWLPEQMTEWLAFRMKRSGKEVRMLVASLSEQAKALGYGSVDDLLQALSTSSPPGSATP